MTAHLPPRCSISAMVGYGSGGSGKIVILNSGNFPAFSTYLNQTWLFNGANGNGDWTQLGVTSSAIDPTGPLGPALNGVKWSGRIGPAMAYDGTNIMLYGGQGASSLAGVFQDTWLFNTTSLTWSQSFPAVTPYGRYNAEASNLTTGGAVMFGGEIVGQLLNETWFWSGSNWSQVAVANGAGPSARIGHCMATGASSVLLFGGRGNNSQFNDTWSYTTAGGWVKLNPATSPSIRDGACMCYDSVNSVWVLYGGQNSQNFLVETWTFNGTTWKQIPMPNIDGTHPSGRVGAQMAFDTVSGRSIMFGGVEGANSSYAANATWAFNAATNIWTSL